MAGAAEHEDLCEAALFYLLDGCGCLWRTPTRRPAHGGR